MSKSCMQVEISVGFKSMEQRLIFEALVMPEIQEVLRKYSSLLLPEEGECENE